MLPTNKEHNYLSIVIALNRNNKNLESLLTNITEFCQKNFHNFEIIIVDNNAPKDNVNSLINKVINSNLHINLVTLPYELKKEQAILSGVDASIGDYVFEFEDTMLDYSHQDLWKMYQACLSGNDIVSLKPNYKLSFFTLIFYKLLNKYSNTNNNLYHSRVNLLSRRAINRVGSMNKVIYYRKYTYSNSGLKYALIEYNSILNNKYKPRLNLANIDFGIDVTIIFTNLGYQISIIFSLLFATISIFALLYSIFAYIIFNVANGWTTIMLLLSVSFTGIFVCFGIVIKYLSLIILNQRHDISKVASKKRVL